MVRIVVLLALLLAGLLPLPVSASQEEVVVKVGNQGTFMEDGQSVEVKLWVRCPKDPPVLEAFVYLSQDGAESDFGFFPLECAGHTQKITVLIPLFEDVPLQPGLAFASAFVLLEDPDTGDTLSGQSFEPIKIR